MNFAYTLRHEIERDIFSLQDLRTLMLPMSQSAIHSGITRSLRSKDFLKLKRGLYMFSKNLRRDSISKLSVANKLYHPSYISFESALSYHGLMPEAVYTTTSACFQRKNKTFTNELGDFSFDYIPCKPFFMGIISDRGVLIASALRSLLDHIYCRRKAYNTFEELHGDLRIERNTLENEVKKHAILELELLAKSYKKTHVYRFYEMLIRTFK